MSLEGPNTELYSGNHEGKLGGIHEICSHSGGYKDDIPWGDINGSDGLVLSAFGKPSTGVIMTTKGQERSF